MALKVRYLYAILIVLFSITNTFGQEGKLDSLLKTATKTQDNDEKISLYLQIAGEYMFVSPDSASVYAEKALILSQSNNNKEGECEAYSIIGTTHYMREQSSAALSYFQKALAIAEEEKLDKNKASIIGNMGAVHSTDKDFEKAILLFNQALEIDKKIGNKKGQAIRLSSISTAYFQKGDFSNAIKYGYESVEILKLVGSNTNVAISYSNLAQMCHAQNQNKQAIKYLIEAEKLLDEKQYGLLKVIYSHLGNIWIDEGDNEKGVKYLKKSIYYGSFSKSPCSDQKSQINLAKVFIAIEELDSAALIAQKILSDSSTCIEKNITEAFARLILSEIAVKHSNWEKAKKEAHIAFKKFSEDPSYKMEKSKAANLLAKVYTHQKNYKQALHYSTIHFQLEDYIFSERNLKELVKRESEFKFKLERQAIEAKNKEESFVLTTKIKRQKNIQNLSIVLGIIAILLVVFFYRLSSSRKRANNELREKNILVNKQKGEIETTNKELIELSEHKEFFTQMIAHDLKNPLNIINVFSSLVPSIQNLKYIKQASTQMSNLVKNMLDVRKFEKKGIAIQKSEVGVMEVVKEAINGSTLLLQTKSVVVNSHIDVALVVNADKEMLVRVFENLITNAAKYSNSGKTIEVTATFDEQTKYVEVLVADNGFGIEEDAVPLIFDKYWQLNPNNNGISASTGLGLAFCKLVVEEHGGSIKVESKIDEGTSFTILLPQGRKNGNKPSAEKVEELTEDEILSAEHKNNPEVIAYFDELKELKVFEAGKVSDVLAKLEQYKISELWKSQVFATVFNGDQKGYDKLLAMVFE